MNTNIKINTHIMIFNKHKKIRKSYRKTSYSGYVFSVTFRTEKKAALSTVR